ncbi:hypothetical protein QAD02_006180 [Eretmocerus hayati]|uniref:Uncharacterized protein n=1 Tax=Eretmocerus hayati TaxID=131215 RepID=A0ACC2N188_9HYME|nr:hypothetical protein QAD02_006180 [Eretmocerus hayati]
MKVDNSQVECSFTQWYPHFNKNSLEAVTLTIPDDVCKYLEHDAFVLPVEATTNTLASNSEWSDGTAVDDEVDEGDEEQPTFPDFSKQIQDTIDEFGAVFVKSNWCSPSDATWVSATKTLKCSSLEDVYLLIKSSDRISKDLSSVRSCNDRSNLIKPCLVLKKWRDIDPCTEFRCFVVNRRLVGISQRDVSQYYKHIENEKYDIQRDIQTLFSEKIRDSFTLENYSFDVTRYKKDKVKIVDFGLLDDSVMKNTLFTMEEIKSDISETPEFRFIAEDMGIQPKNLRQFCIPKEINEFFQSTEGISMMDAIRKEVQEQRLEDSVDDQTNS